LGEKKNIQGNYRVDWVVLVLVEHTGARIGREKITKNGCLCNDRIKEYRCWIRVIGGVLPSSQKKKSLLLYPTTVGGRKVRKTSKKVRGHLNQGQRREKEPGGSLFYKNVQKKKKTKTG